LALINHPKDYVLLLVDSEEALSTDVWRHLASRTGDGWQKPHDMGDDKAYLMVQVMESWFLADPEFLGGYFGNGFSRAALPSRNNLEEIPKQDVYSSLENAAKKTKKQRYHKTRDGFPILAGISPDLVRRSSPQAESLLSTLEQVAAS
jgi:hypothetical protein